MNAHQQWVPMVKRICIEDCKRVASPCYPSPTVQHWRSNCPFIDSSFPASFDLLFLEMHTLHLKSWMGEMLEVGDSSSIYMNTCSLLQTSSCDYGCFLHSLWHHCYVSWCRYHSAILYLDGSQGGSGWRYEKLTTDATNPEWMFWSLKSLTLQMLASIRNFLPASLACSQDSSQIPQVLIVDSLHGWIFLICAKKAKERLQ